MLNSLKVIILRGVLASGGIICFFLSLASLMPVCAGSPSETNSYLVSIMRLGKMENQFCAYLSIENDGYRLKSKSHHDIILSPEIQSGGLSPGNYVLKLLHQNLKIESLPAVGSMNGKTFTLATKSPTDIQLVPQSCGDGTAQVDHWYSPFKDNSRSTFASISRRVASGFGDSRVAGEAGHRHAGVDLTGTFSEEVYPIATGLVMALSLKELNGMLLIEHHLTDGTVVYSKYIHIKDIPVSVGQQVTADTMIGRLFDKKTFKKSHYKHNHLHLEIRKDYEDKGTDSSYATTKKLLELHCYDPIKFLHDHLSGDTNHPQGVSKR